MNFTIPPKKNTEYEIGETAVLAAIRQVAEETGFGRVTVEIKDGKIRLVEVSTTVLVSRNDAIIPKAVEQSGE